MNTKIKFTIFIVLVVVVIGGFGIYSALKPAAPNKLDDFAKCIADSGTKFYGAFWCTHCQAQKEEFGSAEQYLPYIECSNPDNTQTQVCIDNKIEAYPTWIFPDETSLTGEIPLETLAEKTECVLPQ